MALGVLTMITAGYFSAHRSLFSESSGHAILVVTWLVAGVNLMIGIGAWQEKRPAVVAGAWVFPIFSVLQVISLALGFAWTKLASALLFFWISREYRRALKGWDDAETDADGRDERPLISIVLLLSAPRYLEDKILAQEVQSAWGGDYTSEDEEKADGFVVGESPMFIVKSPHGMFMIHNRSNPYFDDLDEVVEGIGELRLRKTVADHRAWLSVDLLAPFDQSLPPEDFYAPVTRLVYELAGDGNDILAVMRPETGQINLWGDDVLEVLLQPRGFDEFNRVRSAPAVLEVPSDDPAMLAAVAEARARWAEFVAAFHARAEGDHFTVKAPITRGETTEFIWIEVTGLEPDFVHGKLGNDPVNLEGLALGDTVEVPVADMNDWCYLTGDDKPTGLFSLKAIAEAQKRLAEP